MACCNPANLGTEHNTLLILAHPRVTHICTHFKKNDSEARKPSSYRPAASRNSTWTRFKANGITGTPW